MLLLALALLAGSIAAPIFMRDFVPMLSNLKGSIDEAAHRFIGEGTVNILGQPMNADQIGQKAVAALSNWLGQYGEIFSLAAAGVEVTFGVVLQFVLLIYFLVGDRKSRPACSGWFPRIKGLSQVPFCKHSSQCSGATL